MVKFINKYVITLILFVIWLLFFDKNDYWTQRELSRQLKKIYEEKKYYQTEIDKNKQSIDDLKNNMQSIDQFARERYWMKKDNEDVYVVLTRNKN
ncbi:MAG: septum formation initiator family protein [Bacteroidia bacterium]